MSIDLRDLVSHFAAISVVVVSVLEGACLVLPVTAVAYAMRHRARTIRVISVAPTAVVALPISVVQGFVVHMSVWKPPL